MTQELKELIEAIIADNVITDKERAVLHARAAREGISADEIDVLVEGKLIQRSNNSKSDSGSGAVAKEPPSPPPIAKASPKTERNAAYGVVRKCPNCGASIEKVATICHDCGYEFRGVGAVSSVKELSDRLGKASKDDAKDIIQNFPVPTTKEDLLEFIFFTKSKAFAFEEGTGPYRAKYYECIDKAAFFFGDDPQVAPIIAEGRRNRKNLWKNFSKDVKIVILFILGYGILMALGFILAEL